MVASSQQALTASLTSFVPKLVARRMVNDPAPPTAPMADRCSAAVMFADISGFTALAERMSNGNDEAPEQLAHLLNSTFSDLIEIIHRHGGEVTKFAGDGLLALWPIPEGFARLGDDARRALGGMVRRASQCALEAQAALDGRQAPDGTPLALGIGLGAGDVYSVHLGGIFGRWEFLLSGGPLVQMSLAKEKARPGRIVLSPEAWQLAEGACQGRELAGGFVELAALSTVEEVVPVQELRLGSDAVDGLEAYIPAAILSRLEAGHHEWLSEMRRVTVLFIKLPSYGTSITHPYARTLPEAQAVMTGLQTALYHHAGSINKFNVDDKGITLVAAMGLPPLTHRDDAKRGLHAAIEMQTALRELGRPSAIGVATGRVFCGPIGHHRRREYTVVGNDVNMAARMMQAAEARMEERRQSSVVLCDQATFEAASSSYGHVGRPTGELSFRRIPHIRVKGRSDPVVAYEPSLTEPRVYPAARRRSRRRMRMVGREPERRILRQQLTALREAADEPFTSVVFVEGEEGVGKSQLIHELQAQATEFGLSVLTGHGSQLETTGPFHAWAPIFRQVFSINQPYVEVGQQRANVLARLPMMPGERGYPALALRLSPLLNAVLPLDFPENRLTMEMAPAVRQRTTRLFLLRLLQLAFTGSRSGRQAPRIIVLEDAQWMDLASWELALSVSRQVRPLLMVIVSRTLSDSGLNHSVPLPCQRLLRAPRTVRLPVGALEQSQTAILAGQHLRVASLPDELPVALHSRAGGVPLFIEAMVDAWKASGFISVSTDRCDLRASDTELQTGAGPGVIHKIITGRIDQLQPDLQMVLKLASVADPPVALDTLRLAFPLAEKQAEVGNMVRSLVELGFLRTFQSGSRSTYRFSYQLLREVVYGLLTRSQKSRLQRLLSRAA